jgi:uncharacterized protein YodC (DUF2158 family)
MTQDEPLMLKSGGPPMTAVAYVGPTGAQRTVVLCEWFDNEGEKWSKDFPIECLISYDILRDPSGSGMIH